jgi:hypothetical protein
LDTDTPVPTATVTSEFGISNADATATAAAEDAGEEGGRSSLSILLWVFIGLAVLFLFAGGAMELIRWLNSRRV